MNPHRRFCRCFKTSSAVISILVHAVAKKPSNQRPPLSHFPDSWHHRALRIMEAGVIARSVSCYSIHLQWHDP